MHQPVPWPLQRSSMKFARPAESKKPGSNCWERARKIPKRSCGQRLPSIIAQDHLREGETKPAVEIFELNLLAYPDSADAEGNLADAYLANGQKDLARQHAERALALLDSHGAPASSWTDTGEYRGEIRRDAEKILKELGANTTN